MCACFCACTSIQYLHICIYQGAISQCPLVVYAPVLLCHPTLPHDYPQEGDGPYPLGRMLSHIHKLNKDESKNMQAVFPPLPRQLHRMYCRKTRIDQAGGRPTAGITSWFTGWYLCFFIRDMMWVARWSFSMLACSTDAAWGRIFNRDLHSFEFKPMSRLFHRNICKWYVKACWL